MRKNTRHGTIMNIVIAMMAITSLVSCRKEYSTIEPTVTPTPISESGDYTGFYLLCEGNMGSNKATLDYYDYKTGIYSKNIFPKANPGLARELGDVGNDLKIYGGKLYAVINCSHFVEVMDVRNAKHITQISIPNCRYITFSGKYAYVSSYAGPVEIDPNARKGYVAKIDTTTLEVVAECIVGYQPEEMAVAGNKLYVANSGGYMAPNYDRTVSVIDLSTFQVIKTIDAGINLHRMAKDRFGNIYVSSRGDYSSIPSKTFVISTVTDEVVETLELLPNSGMAVCGDSLYVYSAEWSNALSKNIVSYAIYNTKTRNIDSRNIITDGTGQTISTPYGIAVNPGTRDFFIADAKDYVTPGTLFCFSKDGQLKWKVTTGDIPAHVAFTTQHVQLP
ncbi:MAG: YncE family protein [Bacteroidales bacterium]|nr:YncE family protein [Bacteroidales bacterium]MBP5518938.1 YncE family protein [Bacteroidales bacterium]